MPDNNALFVSASIRTAQGAWSSIREGDFLRKTRRIWAVPGLTGSVIVVGAPRASSARDGSIRSGLRVVADVLHLRAWRDLDPVACFLLAAYTAAIAQPLIFGTLGATIRGLMTPVK